MSITFVKTSFPNIKLGYTNREKGFSRESFDKFNLSYNVGDFAKCVDDNRGLFKSHINAEVKWLNQTHTNVINNFEDYDNLECDAICTDKPNQACIVLTADCLPIILFDKKHQKLPQFMLDGKV